MPGARSPNQAYILPLMSEPLVLEVFSDYV
jgi:hypothetical protein